MALLFSMLSSLVEHQKWLFEAQERVAYRGTFEPLALD